MEARVRATTSPRRGRGHVGQREMYNGKMQQHVHEHVVRRHLHEDDVDIERDVLFLRGQLFTRPLLALAQ